MAITLRPPHQDGHAQELPFQLTVDASLLEQAPARLAYQRGLLRAKLEALHAAERLAAWARPLLIAILVVSFLHLFHEIGKIAPPEVERLVLPAWLHWLSAALLTAAVDATALYLVACRSVAEHVAKGHRSDMAVGFYYLLTGALNLQFVLSFSGLPPQIGVVTMALTLVGAVLLGLLVPVSIAAVERARQVVELARLTLLVETETLRGLVAGEMMGEATGEDASSASPSVMRASTQPPEVAEEPAPPHLLEIGRPVAYTVDDLLTVCVTDNGVLITPKLVRERLGCSEASAHRLLQTAVEAGHLERAARGAYRPTRANT